MADKFTSNPITKTISTTRRKLLALFMGSAAVGAIAHSRVAAAETTADDLRFPGDEPDHKVVYQFNKADGDYHQQVLFSVGAMLRKYGDNIRIVVACIGPGIHILARSPQRPVSEETRQRVTSLAEYGVQFHACGNTLIALNWSAEDLLPFAKIVTVGAADMMELQEQGYAYLSW